MNGKIAALTVIAASLVGACTTARSADSMTVRGSAVLANPAGQNVGSAEIVQRGENLHLRARVSGQTPGDHGIHLHMTGKCEAPGFTTAADHLNPGAHQHGSLNPAGPHTGDLPNISVQPDGSGVLEAALTGTAADLMATIFDGDGTAVVFHNGPDDYKTDPSGNSGGRIACGVLGRMPG